MNESINLVEILKNCPKGTKLYSPLFGEGEFLRINNGDDSFPIAVISKGGIPNCFDATGKTYYSHNNGECLLFPSKDQMDWSKFTAPWYKKEKFDPNTLKSFDRVLVRDYNNMEWSCDILSHIKQEDLFPYVGIGSEWKCCIPYNDDTKHLVGTTDAAPEFYRYYED